MLGNSERGSTVLSIIAPPIFVLGLILLAWAIYLSFDNAKKEFEIERLKKKENMLKNQGNAVEKKIEDINSFMGLKMLSDNERNSLKDDVDRERKIFLGAEEKDDQKKIRGISITKNNVAYKYVANMVDNYLLGKVWLQKRLDELKEKIKKITFNYLKVSDEKIKERFEKLNPNLKYDKDLFFQNYPSYTNLIITLDYVTNQLSGFLKQKKKQYSNIQTLINRMQDYYAFLEKFDTESMGKFSTIRRDNLKEVCDYISKVYDKEIRITNYINEKTKSINDMTKSIEDEEKTLSSEVNKLRNTLDNLRVVGILKKDVFNYGGTVVREEYSSKIVFTSYGSKDGLRKGHIFYVFDFFPIGGYRWKGLIEIIEVEDTRSKAKILYENFVNNPIKTGDYLSSPFFKKGNKTRVYIYGRVEKTIFGFSYNELVEHLESLGVIVQRDVYDKQGKLIKSGYDLYTDFVIKGQEKMGIDIKFDKQWSEILELGIPVVSLYDLLPILGGYIKLIK